MTRIRSMRSTEELFRTRILGLRRSSRFRLNWLMYSRFMENVSVYIAAIKRKMRLRRDFTIGLKLLTRVVLANAAILFALILETWPIGLFYWIITEKNFILICGRPSNIDGLLMLLLKRAG